LKRIVTDIMNPNSTPQQPERRANPRLRGVFDQAYGIAFRLLDPKQPTVSNHFLRVALHDAFPDLHLQDIAILAVAVERVFHERNKAGSQ
jgi:hypothetical protein